MSNFGSFQAGIASHEIGHALGLWHEHSRPDRDNFVKVNTGNVAAGGLGNFRKIRSADHFGVTYDFGSVMHYHRKVSKT